MKNPELKRALSCLPAVAMAGIIASLALVGCSAEEEEVAVVTPPPAPPPPPPKPAVASIADLMQELNIDPRVVLPEDQAPSTTEERKAVLVFFDAFARGDAKNLKTMLPATDQKELDALVKSGDWKKVTEGTTEIAIQTGTNAVGQKCALAVFTAMGTLQPQMWYYTIEDEKPTFDAAPTPPGIIDLLSGDWIVSWHEILAKELALAQQPDVSMEPIKTSREGDDKKKDGGPDTISKGPTAGKKIGRPKIPGASPPKGPSFKK